MVFRFKRPLKRLVVAGLSLVVLTAACAFSYSLFLFVQFENNAMAERFIGKIVDDLAKEQVLSSMNLTIDLDPEESRIAGRAAMTFLLPPVRSHLFLRQIFFLFPTDLIFYLHPGLAIETVHWGDRNLAYKQIHSRVFVDLAGKHPPDGVIVLDVRYKGQLRGPAWSSLFASDRVYLDPRDHYYPNLENRACTVGITLNLPEGFTSLLPDERAQDKRQTDSVRTSFSFAEPVSFFALGASKSTMRDFQVGKMTYSFFHWEGSDSWLIGTLESIHQFFETRLPAARTTGIHLIKHSGPLPGGIQFDETGTVLLSSEFTEKELAFITALYWIGAVEQGRKDQGGLGLFSRVEIARALALYYTQRRRGDSVYSKDLLALSERPLDFAANEKKTGDPLGATTGGKGAFLLSILRNKVGDDAFNEILQQILIQPGKPGQEPWRCWNEVTTRICGENLRWFFQRWVAEGRWLDLAISGFSVEEHSLGNRVRLAVENKGNLNLPDKVKALFITDTGSVAKMLQIERSRNVHVDYFQDRVLGVVLDPEIHWFDADRGNNVAYLDPQPYLVMPSEDNRFLAVAYRKKAVSDQWALIVLRTDGEENLTFYLNQSPSRIEWINENRLLVYAYSPGFGSAAEDPKGVTYLVDTLLRKAESFPMGTAVSASHSGRFLLINERKDNIWQHRIKDLNNKLTRSAFGGIPYSLDWVPGSDFIIPGYPTVYQGDVEIYNPDGSVAYLFKKSGSRLYDFQGFEEGLAFLRDRQGENFLYTIGSAEQEPRMLAELEGRSISFKVSRFGGMIQLREGLGDDLVRMSRIDPTHGRRDLLFEGLAEGIYPVFCDKGLLTMKTHAGLGGRFFRDILFHPFGEKEGFYITQTQASEGILALVGNQRYLYYAEEVQVPWSALSAFNNHRFFRYDFLNREISEIDLNRYAP